MSTKKGVLSLGVGAIGFSSQEIVSEPIPEGKEIHYSSSQISRDQSDSSGSPESNSRQQIVSEGDDVSKKDPVAETTDAFVTASENELQRKADP